MFKVAYIGKLPNGRYRVYSRDGKNLGTYHSKSKAEQRLKQVEMFKHMDKNKKKNRKKSFENIYNNLNKTAGEQTPTKTYSSVMRELNKNDPEKLKEFMASYKRAFDDAIKNDIEYPEQVALLEALQTIKDPSAS